MDIFFNFFPILFFLAFFGVFGMIIYTMIREMKRERKNDQSPRLTVSATVVTKREELRRYGSQNGAGRIRTQYYVTFQVSSGDRMELPVEGYQYGMMVEGDRGDLTFQGTRFLNFERM